MSVEDIALQDAMERLALTQDFAYLTNHIAERKFEYLESLSHTDAANSIEVARIQGRVQALDEVIRIRTDAADAKRKRTA